MRQIVNASTESLVPFVQDSVQPGSVIDTDGWPGYLPLESKGYVHEVTFLKGKKTPSELMPRVHRVISLLKRWLMGTHQGAVSHKHLDYYVDDFSRTLGDCLPNVWVSGKHAAPRRWRVGRGVR